MSAAQLPVVLVAAGGDGVAQVGPGQHVAAGRSPDVRREVLQPPPTVRDADGRVVSVKDWLTHYWPDGPGWPAIVTEFYNRAAADPVIDEF